MCKISDYKRLPVSPGLLVTAIAFNLDIFTPKLSPGTFSMAFWTTFGMSLACWFMAMEGMTPPRVVNSCLDRQSPTKRPLSGQMTAAPVSSQLDSMPRTKFRRGKEFNKCRRTTNVKKNKFYSGYKNIILPKSLLKFKTFLQSAMTR